MTLSAKSLEVLAALRACVESSTYPVWGIDGFAQVYLDNVDSCGPPGREARSRGPGMSDAPEAAWALAKAWTAAEDAGAERPPRWGEGDAEQLFRVAQLIVAYDTVERLRAAGFKITRI